MRADPPHHRRVVSRVLAVGRAAVEGHAADAAHVVACRVGEARRALNQGGGGGAWRALDSSAWLHPTLERSVEVGGGRASGGATPQSRLVGDVAGARKQQPVRAGPCPSHPHSMSSLQRRATS